MTVGRLGSGHTCSCSQYYSRLHNRICYIEVSEILAHVVLLLEHKRQKRILYYLQRLLLGEVSSRARIIFNFPEYLIFFAKSCFVKIFKTVPSRFI